MLRQFVPTLLLLTICVVCAVASQGADAGANKPALSAIQPRLLLFNRRNDNQHQQPIIIVQPSQDSERSRPRPYWPDFYPYPEYPPPRPNRGGSNYPSIVIVNPNNAQNLTFPAAPAAATTGRRSGAFRREQIPIIDLLQGLNAQDDDSEVINAAEIESEAAPVAAAPLAQYATVVEEQPSEEDPSEDELALLERQAARGLSTKNLLSFLLQDKRRRRFQEAVASIYLRNYNQNRK